MKQSDISDLTEAVTQANASECETGSRAEDKVSLPVNVASATGPRTPKGKQRSSRNALKYGIFSKFLILKSESRAAYQSVLNGLREDLQPQGTLEAALVESLAVLLWRKRRLLQAESAEISMEHIFRDLDAYEKQQVETWDRYRAGETAGGMLRPSPNPFLVQEAIRILTKMRKHLKESGFDQNIGSFLLKKLYGTDHDGEPPGGLYRQFETLLFFTTMAQNKNESAVVETLKNTMVECFNIEIEWLESQEFMRKNVQDLKGKFQALADLIPRQDAMDRLVRYECHMSREFDRVLNQLERVQRMRKGHPPSPTLNVNVS